MQNFTILRKSFNLADFNKKISVNDTKDTNPCTTYDFELKKDIQGNSIVPEEYKKAKYTVRYTNDPRSDIWKQNFQFQKMEQLGKRDSPINHSENYTDYMYDGISKKLKELKTNELISINNQGGLSISKNQIYSDNILPVLGFEDKGLQNSKINNSFKEKSIIADIKIDV